jgi:hypothetical protein
MEEKKEVESKFPNRIRISRKNFKRGDEIHIQSQLISWETHSFIIVDLDDEISKITIIHVWKNNEGERIKVRKDKLSILDINDNTKFYKRNYDEKDKRTPDEVIIKAQTLIGHEWNYVPLHYNCQHFTRLCIIKENVDNYHIKYPIAKELNEDYNNLVKGVMGYMPNILLSLVAGGVLTWLSFQPIN